jgi:AcrR family transcriptional regulator
VPKQTFFNLPEGKREKFLEIAIQEFAENDYLNASVSKIVQRAGISKGSLYQYFDDKEDLYQHLLDLVVEKKAQFLQGQQPPEPGLGIFAYLSWLFRQGLGFELAYPELARLGYRALYGDSSPTRKTLEQAREASRQYFYQLIEQGIAQGDVRADVDPSLAAYVFDAVFSNLGEYLLSRSGVDRDRLAREGTFPVESPEVQSIFDQLMQIMECGLGRCEDRNSWSGGLK